MTQIRRPSDQRLIAALRAALRNVGIKHRVLDIGRRENVYESSNPSEIIEVSLADGSMLTLLCKRGRSHERDRWGLRGGISYEADVYRYVLADQHGVPRFYGAHEDHRTGLTSLFVEYLGEGWQLDLGPEDAIVDAAAMVGELHRRAAARMRSQPRLNRYGARYFRSCVRAARIAAERWRDRAPSIDRLLDTFEGELGCLLSAPRTLVHGEFTPHNVVWADDRPHAVDWELAGVGPGELDIACLTDEWAPDEVERATAAYARSRWPDGPQHDFGRAVGAARLYWVFRWLTDPEQTGTEDEIAWVAKRLNHLAGQPAQTKLRNA